MDFVENHKPVKIRLGNRNRNSVPEPLLKGLKDIKLEYPAEYSTLVTLEGFMNGLIAVEKKYASFLENIKPEVVEFVEAGFIEWMKHLPVLVFLSGKIGSGKSFLAKHVQESLKDSTIISFATPVKEIATKHFGWDGKKDERGRKLLQTIAHEAGRVYDPNIWVEKAADWFIHNDTEFLQSVIIFDDNRYQNEIDYFAQDIYSTFCWQDIDMFGTPTFNHNFPVRFNNLFPSVTIRIESEDSNSTDGHASENQVVKSEYTVTNIKGDSNRLRDNTLFITQLIHKASTEHTMKIHGLKEFFSNLRSEKPS